MERPVAMVGSMGSMPEVVRCIDEDRWGWWEGVEWGKWGDMGLAVFSDVEARSGGAVEDDMAPSTGRGRIIWGLQWRWLRSGP
jgi:hypothetical protein